MTTLAFIGGSTADQTGAYTDSDWVRSTSGVSLPTNARLADNGTRPVYVERAKCYWAGRGGTATLALQIGSKSSTYRDVSSSASAQDSGWITIGYLASNGGTVQTRINHSDTTSFYFGHDNTTGSVESEGGGSWDGALSGQVDYYQIPTAPTSVSVAQDGLSNAVDISWTAPSDDGGTAVTSYKIIWSYDSGFAGSTTVATGSSATTYKLTGLTYGSIVYVKVSAVNKVGTAGGTSSVYSSSANAYLIPPDLPLDGWAHFGTATNNTWDLDHTAIPALIPETGMLLTGTSTATGGSYATGAVGIEKTYTDLIIGRQYIVSGKAILRTSGVPANIYRFAVTGIGNGSSVTLSSIVTGSTIPSYTFTATATTHTVQIELAETFTVSTVGVQESVAFYDYALTRVATDLPYRVQDNLYTTSLMDHFDLATQSVGATWWVDKNNVTQFAQDFDYVLPTATFSDEVADGNLYYTNIETAYDTSAVINQITFNNMGVKDNQYGTAQVEAYEVEWVDSDTASVDEWGARAFTLGTNLRTELTAQNLVSSPSVENQLVNYGSTNWNVTNEQPSVDSSGSWAAKDGLWAVRARNITGSGTLVYVGDDLKMPAVAGQTFYAVAYGGHSNSSSVRGRTRIAWFDDSGAVIANTLGSYVTYTSARTWYKTTTSGTAPAGTVAAGIYIETTRSTGAVFANGTKLWGDAFYFGTTNVSDWFDGNTADTATYIYSWDGGNNDSTSSRYTNILDTRTGELLAEFSTPIVRVSSLRWNTAQNPVIAATLDIGSLIIVTFKGTTDTYRVVGINHDITPDRWMMDLQVAKVI